MPRIDRPAALALVGGLAGVALYSIQYWSRPSLLIDEVRLSLDIAGSSWLGLTRPLGFDQTAPLLFLWAEKLATVIGGVNEYALHLLPYLASVALLPLMWRVAERLIGRWGAAFAVAITAVSPLLAQYARQAKPYSLDAVCAVLVILWALDALDAPDDPRKVRRLMVAGVVSVWISTPAIFVVTGVLLALAAAPKAMRPPVAGLAWGGGATLVSFAAAYLWIYRPATTDPYIRQFWEYSLLSVWRPGLLGRAWQGAREVLWQAFVGGSTEPPTPDIYQFAVTITAGPLLVLLGLGLARLTAWAGRPRATIVWAPLGVAIVASLFGKYPIAARTMLFAVPTIVLAAAAGGVAIARSFQGSSQPLVAGLVATCLLGSALPLDVALITHRKAWENAREAVQLYRARRGPGDPVYVYTNALPAWTFYTTDWRAPDRERLARMTRLGSFGGPSFENAPPRGRAVRQDEGDSLVYPLWGGREIIGLFHGAQWRSGVGLAGSVVDTNWQANETRRIAAAADPVVWVMTIRAAGEDSLLYGSTGLCVDSVVARNGFALARLERPPAPGRCPRAGPVQRASAHPR